jgi:hypothetical protein
MKKKILEEFLKEFLETNKILEIKGKRQVGKKIMKNFFYINIQDENGRQNRLGISKGSYSGDIHLAIGEITQFCEENTIKLESYGWGYGKMIINEDFKYNYNQYGIDVEMMLGFIGRINDKIMRKSLHEEIILRFSSNEDFTTVDKIQNINRP